MHHISDVYDLIKAMNAQEKRYFKLQATAHSKNKREHKLVALFSAYDMLPPQHSDADLLNHLTYKPTPNQLASIKYELYKQLLNSLSLFHRDKSIEAELRSALAHIEILYNKGLYRQCTKIVKRARRKAEQISKHTLLVEVLSWERKLLLRRRSNDFQQALRQFHDQQLEVLDQLVLTIRYEDLADKVQEAHSSHVRLKSSGAQAELREILASEMLKVETDDLPFHAQLNVLQIRGNFDWFSGHPTAAMNWYRAAIETWEAHPAHITNEPDNYKRYLTNFLSCMIVLHETDEFRATLSKIKSIPSASVESELTSFGIVTYLELVHCLHTGQLQQARELILHFESESPKYIQRLRPDRLINLYFNCSIIYFLSGEYSKSLAYINAIYNLSDADPKKDIQEFLRIAQLVIHFELGDYEILENMLRTAQRYLSNRKQLKEFERAVLSGMRKLLNAADEQAQNKALQTLRQDLMTLLHDDKQTDPLGIIELLFWIDSRLLKITIGELFSKRVQQNPGRDKVALFAD